MAVLSGLRGQSWGAGVDVAATERRWQRSRDSPPKRSSSTRCRPTPPLALHEAIVAPEWIDYNGHMTEYRYLEVLADTTDVFLPLIGAGADYAASGRSYYTVETHIRHLGEAHAGDRLTVTTQLLGHDAKRLHLFHEIRRADDGSPVATGEHMLLHVDATAGRAVAAGAEVLAASGADRRRPGRAAPAQRAPAARSAPVRRPPRPPPIPD